MAAKSIGLAWIVVKDFKKAVKFYTEVAGLKLIEMNEEWGWAELEGHEEGGMRLGIAQDNAQCPGPTRPGQNAVLTFTVDNLEKEMQHLQKQGATLIGNVEIVPGHVKMQSIKDTEGNVFQIVELIPQESCSTQKHSCCCC